MNCGTASSEKVGIKATLGFILGTATNIEVIVASLFSAWTKLLNKHAIVGDARHHDTHLTSRQWRMDGHYESFSEDRLSYNTVILYDATCYSPEFWTSNWVSRFSCKLVPLPEPMMDQSCICHQEPLLLEWINLNLSMSNQWPLLLTWFNFNPSMGM